MINQMISSVRIGEDLLLNGFAFPSSIYIPWDKSSSLECQSKKDVYWKVYLTNGTIRIMREKLIRLKEFERNRDGFYQCHCVDHSIKSEGVFLFSNGNCLLIPSALVSFSFFVAARSIDRHWTALTEFHEDLLTICRPIYFIDGFNEQFIELIDNKQTVRYNRSALLVKHIRSTTHLLCKLLIETTCVGIRVKTLILPSIVIVSHQRSFLQSRLHRFR